MEEVTSMHLIVLGNGFDLASGLKTSYEEYFKNVEENNKLFVFLDEFVFGKHPSKFRNDKNYKLNKSEPNRTLHKSELNEIILFKFNQFEKEYKKNDLSAFHLYLWYLKKTKTLNNTEWSNIERIIKRTLNTDSKFLVKVSNTKDEIVEDLIIKAMNKNYYNGWGSEYDQNYLENILHYVDHETRLNTVIDFLTVEDATIGGKIRSTIVKKELIKFENNFKIYIEDLYTKNIIAKKGNLYKYRDNLGKLLENDFENMVIFNFNYTDFSSIDKSHIFKFERSKIAYDVLQINVHGTYYKNIIFGIDQSTVEPRKNEQLIFTKTFRKMESHANFPIINLPDKAKITGISFYGHSFSEADFSYFHSLFDYYDIYGSSIPLIFNYSIYGDKNDYETIKTNHYLSIMNLLREYGTTMFEKDKGKNLVHKLLIENRIIIKEIKLGSITYDKKNNH